MSNGKPGFFQEALSPGKLLLITATMREGKSNVASYLIENGVPLGYNFYTNMIFFDYDEIDDAIAEGILKQPKSWYRRVPSEVKTKTKMSEFILGLYNTRRNITLLDEALLFAGSKKGVSKDIRWFEGFVTQIGKFDSSIALIAQAKSKLATLLKEDIPSFELKIHKISFTNRFIEVWYNPPQNVDNPVDPYQVDTWWNIPPTHFPYDTLAPAGLEYDLDMEAFINKISKLNSLQVRKQIPSIVEKLLKSDKNNKSKSKSKREVIIEKLSTHPNLDTSSIAVLSKCSARYVREIKSELEKQ